MDIINMFIAIVGFSFTIYQFIHQNKENRKTTIEQNNKNWYLSVLVIPYLERTNVFFEELSNSIKEQKKSPNKRDLLLLAQEQYLYKEKIEAFFSPLESSISSYDGSLREDISNLEMELQDEVTKLLSCIDLISSEEIEKRIMEYKGKLIGVLYVPIRK